MRDTDRDRVSHLVVRRDSAIGRVADLRGKTVAAGAKDSPQATLIPLGLLQRHGLEPGRDFKVRRFDVLVGKHGDHIGGEREALRALRRGRGGRLRHARPELGALDARTARSTRASTASWPRPSRFDHCIFTVRDDFPADVERRWLEALVRDELRQSRPTAR